MNTLLPAKLQDAVDVLYCRSTAFCRTQQSLRSLLCGLLDTTNHSLIDVGAEIVSLPKDYETMVPTADGPNVKLNERKQQIFAEFPVEEAIEGYHVLEERMRALLGYSTKVVLVCLGVMVMHVFFVDHQ